MIVQAKLTNSKTRIERIRIAKLFYLTIWWLKVSDRVEEMKFDKGQSVKCLVEMLCDEKYDSISFESFIEFYPAIKEKLKYVNDLKCRLKENAVSQTDFKKPGHMIKSV